MTDYVYLVTVTEVEAGKIQFSIFDAFDNVEAAKEYYAELVNDGKKNVHVFMNKVKHAYVPPIEVTEHE